MRPFKQEVCESDSFVKKSQCSFFPPIGIPFEGQSSAEIDLKNIVENRILCGARNPQKVPKGLRWSCGHSFSFANERDFWYRVLSVENLLSRARGCYELIEKEAKGAYPFVSKVSSVVQYSDLDDLETELKQILDLSTAINLQKGSHCEIVEDTLEILSLPELVNLVDGLFCNFEYIFGRGKTDFTTELISSHSTIAQLLDKFEGTINSVESEMISFCSAVNAISNTCDEVEKILTRI